METSTRAAAIFLIASLAAYPCEAQDEFAARILAAHNAERAALSLPPLSWSTTLADAAAIWAQHLAVTGQYQHSPRGDRPDQNENLWIGTRGAYTLEEMVGAWADEKHFYRYGVFPGGVSEGHVVGHYTQMIWKGSTEVGCALAAGGGRDVLVCRYSPAGNLIGEKPY